MSPNSGIDSMTVAQHEHWKDQPRAPKGNEDGGQWVKEYVYGGDPFSGNYTITHSTVKELDPNAEIFGGEHSGEKLSGLLNALETSADVILKRVSGNSAALLQEYKKDPLGFETAIEDSFNAQMKKLYGGKWFSTSYWSQNASGQRSIAGLSIRFFDDFLKVLVYQAKNVLEK